MSDPIMDNCCGCNAPPGIESVEGLCPIFGELPLPVSEWNLRRDTLQTTRYLKHVREINTSNGVIFYRTTDVFDLASFTQLPTVVEGTNIYGGSYLDISGWVLLADAIPDDTHRTQTFDVGATDGTVGHVLDTLSMPFTLTDATGLATQACNAVNPGAYLHLYYYADGTDGGYVYFGLDAPNPRVLTVYCQWSPLVPGNHLAIWPGDLSPWCQARNLAFHGSAGIAINDYTTWPNGHAAAPLNVHGPYAEQDVLACVKKGRVRTANGYCEIIRPYDMVNQVYLPTSCGARSNAAGTYLLPIPATTPQTEHGFGSLPLPLNGCCAGYGGL